MWTIQYARYASWLSMTGQLTTVKGFTIKSIKDKKNKVEGLDKESGFHNSSKKQENVSPSQGREKNFPKVHWLGRRHMGFNFCVLQLVSTESHNDIKMMIWVDDVIIFLPPMYTRQVPSSMASAGTLSILFI